MLGRTDAALVNYETFPIVEGILNEKTRMIFRCKKLGTKG